MKISIRKKLLAPILKFLLISCLIALAAPSNASDLANHRKLFLAGEKALEKGNFHRLDQILTKLKGYPLYHYLLFKKLSTTPGAVEQVNDFAAEFSDTRYSTLLQTKLLRFFASQKNWQGYVSHYKKSVNPNLRCYYQWALFQTGQEQKALEGARSLWLVGRSQPKACDPLFERLRLEKGIDGAMAWRRFELSLAKGKVGLAKYVMRYIPKDERQIADFWIKVHRNPQRFMLNDQLWNHNDVRLARIFLHGINRLIPTDPSLALQLWSSKKGKFDFESTQKAAVERRLGISLAVNKDPSAADFLAKIDVAVAALDLLEWRVRNALLRQDWKNVLLYLDQLPEPEQIAARWRFWRARALDEIGDSTRACDVYKEAAEDRSFHGFLAADYLGVDYAWSDRPINLTDSEIGEIEERRNFAAAREFLYLDRQYLARSDWWHGVRKLNKKQILAAAKLAERWDWDQIAIFTIAKAKYWDDLVLRFPLSYKKAILRNANQQNLEPSLVYGVIRQESAFDHLAHSRAGARGLMQIMPRTGKQIARRLKEKWTSSRILFKPEINLKFGTSYLKKLLGQYDNRFAFAVAAYNAGGHRVNRWLQLEKPVPTDIWIENIPFKETRNYVSTVLAYAVIYHKRLHGKLYRVSNLLGATGTIKMAKSKAN